MKTLKYFIFMLLLLNSCEDKKEHTTAVLTDKDNLEDFYQDVDSFWNPTKQDMELITSLSVKAFHQETADFEETVRFNFNDFFLQIVPYVKSGKRVAYVNAICDKETFSNLKGYFYHVNDGGDCYWQVKIDVEKETYLDFSMNGP